MAHLPAIRAQSTTSGPNPLARLASGIARVVRAAMQDGTGGRVMTSEQLWREMSGGGAMTSSGALVNEHTVMTSAEIFACLRILSSSIAMLPLNLVSVDKSGREEVATDHPVQPLLTVAPNGRQTPFEFVQMIMVHLLLYGNFYALVTRSRGRILEIWPLNARRMHVEEDDFGILTYKYGDMKGEVQRFSEAEILHVRGMSRDSILGESTADAAREDAGLGMSMRTYGGKLFANGVRPSGCYEVPGKLSADTLAAIKQQLSDHLASANNAAKVMILDGGAKWTKMSLDSSEAQMIEGRQFTRSQIAMFFGVPPQFLGDLAGSTTWGSGMAQQGKGFLLYVIKPHITNICQSLARALLTYDERRTLYCRFDTHELTEGDAESQAKVSDIYIKNGTLNPNEVRRRLGENPRDGGDKYAPVGGIKPDAAKPANQPKDGVNAP
jgi:HK97 family phage portal protein